MDPSEAPVSLAFGRFRVLAHRRELVADGRVVRLGGRAFDVLIALIEARGAVLSKDALMARVWPDRVVEENNLQAQIVALRKAFGADRNLIRTISGRGYQFTGDIQVVPPNEADQPVGVVGGQPAPLLPRTNIPEPVSGLIGRDEELGEILNLAATHRLVTLTGAGGIGKTTLALALARELRPHFADGVWMAELAPLADGSLVARTVAGAVGAELAGGQPSPERVANALSSKQVLLVLDNCEHVIEAAAIMAEALLHANRAVHVIATSREPLRAEGEWLYPVHPLTVPEENAESQDDPRRFGAVRLFIDRARAAEPHFVPDRRAVETIGAICRRLDGIPLAIELAAARVPALGIGELAARLDNLFQLLTGGRRTALPRHQTLRATLDWSYELLAERERVTLRRLGVFAGYFSLEAASAVVVSDGVTLAELVDGLASLVAKSLVSREADATAPRYRLLDTTRAYAREKLAQSGQGHESLGRRHAGYYRELFAPAEAESELRPQAEWVAIYGQHVADVRAGLDWAFSPKGDLQIGVALTIAAVPLWVQLSLLDECHERVERALHSLNADDPAMARPRMQLSAALGWSLMYGVGRVREAGPAWATTLELADSLDDRDYRLRALWGLCIDQFNNGEFRTALEYARRFADLVANSTDAIELIMGDRILATALHYLGDQNTARQHIDRVLARLGELGQRSQTIRLRFDMRVSTHYFQARILWLQGFADQALRAVEQNIEEGRAIGHALTFCSVLGQAACPIAFLAGDLDTAARYGAMLLAHTQRHPIRLWHLWARCFNGLLAAKRGDPEGLDALRQGFEEAGEAAYLPRFLLLHGELAACLGKAGRVGQGLTLIEEMLTRCKIRDERWYLPELLRINGTLILLRGAEAGATASEDCFREAIDLARRQGAGSWELRAASSLARLLRDQDRPADARAVLEPIYSRFTEGFSTSDLKMAKAFLDGIRQ